MPRCQSPGAESGRDLDQGVEAGHGLRDAAAAEVGDGAIEDRLRALALRRASGQRDEQGSAA